MTDETETKEESNTSMNINSIAGICSLHRYEIYKNYIRLNENTKKKVDNRKN